MTSPESLTKKEAHMTTLTNGLKLAEVATQFLNGRTILRAAGGKNSYDRGDRRCNT